MNKARGFTLIELIFTVTILAVLLAVAAPSFTNVSVGSKVADNANRLAVSVSLARNEAIKRNGLVVLCKSANGDSCTTSGGWEQGWIVFHDVNRDGVKDAAETVVARESAAPDGYQIAGVAPDNGSALHALRFPPTTVGSTQARFTICRVTPAVHTNQRQVEVNATGRPSVTKTPTNPCA